MKVISKSRKNNGKRKVLCCLTGLSAGFINGLFGGGGGMIVVPMLEGLLNYDNKSSHATAILIILPVSIVSGLIYAVFGNFDAKIILPVTLGSVVGGLLGAIFLNRFSNKLISIIFLSIMMFVGVKTLLF